MRPSQVIERAREKVEGAAERTGEVVGKGLREGWGKAKGLGKGLKTELLRPHRKRRGRTRGYSNQTEEMRQLRKDLEELRNTVRQLAKKKG